MIEAAIIEKARTRDDIYGAATALKQSGPWQLGKCPFHDDANPSFGVKNGGWVCFAGCGHGDVIEFYQRWKHVDFVTAVTELVGLPQQKPRAVVAAPRHRSPPATDPSETVRLILAGSGPVTDGTGAHLYLWSRGLIDRWHPLKATGLLAHPALYCTEARKPLPALVAEITSVTGIVTALQRIWVATQLVYENGTGPKDARADLRIRKKTIGPMGNGAVRLADASTVLGLAEGVETALAAMRLFNIPVWATCGATRLGGIAIPNSVDLVVIMGDNAEIGHTAAEAARRNYQRQGIACDVLFPDPRFDDFNSELLQRSAAA